MRFLTVVQKAIRGLSVDVMFIPLLLFFCLDSPVDFAAMNGDVLGGIDSNTDLVALDIGDRNDNIFADPDGLADFARQD